MPPTLDRRTLLSRCTAGFGAVAATALFGKPVGAAAKTPHFAPRAKHIIFLYMDGGPSQVDTFDPKPLLDKYDGRPFPAKMEPTQFDDNGMTLASPWKFRRHGESGIPISSLFPHLSKHADRLAVIRSMTAGFSEHTNANYFLHTGIGIQGRPSMGAWLTYGLGSECDNLPGFVVLNGGLIPPGGLDCFGAGFLPASYQGSVFSAGNPPVENVHRLEPSDAIQRNKLQLMRSLDRSLRDRGADVDAIESAIANWELAYRMQVAVPDLMRLDDETEATLRSYGTQSSYKGTAIFGRLCLLARRLVERGVRFIELTCPHVGHDRWDQHSNLKKGHEDNARAVDQPIAALLSDLAARGLLDETLVVWSGEFGRTPFAQGRNGRDHNPFGFSLWLAGGGVRGGTVYGATDEFGYKAIENRVDLHDLHATMLHLMGLDHERLVFRFGGRDMRLTDVHGKVIREIVA